MEFEKLEHAIKCLEKIKKQDDSVLEMKTTLFDLKRW